LTRLTGRFAHALPLRRTPEAAPTVFTGWTLRFAAQYSGLLSARRHDGCAALRDIARRLIVSQELTNQTWLYDSTDVQIDVAH
jgi:hypothetical protein